uniref:Uncharacterized protein n=1 Tax=Oryza glumipatula TaxID=40148 RepID=A0A0E0AIB4_9ORYZ
MRSSAAHTRATVWGGSVVTIGHKVSPEHVSAADGMDGDEVGQDVDILYRRRLASFHGGGLRWTGRMVQEGNERPCCSVRGWGGDEVGRGAWRACVAGQVGAAHQPAWLGMPLA